MTPTQTTGGKVLAEFNESSCRIVIGAQSAEVPLERRPDGRLTDASRGNVIARIKELMGNGSAASPRPMVGAIAARGVTLRRLTIPPSRPEELDQVLALQIEREFPIAPAQLAWGYLNVDSRTGSGHEILVAAVKRELVEGYADIAAACGLSPTFTLGVLAIGALNKSGGEDFVVVSPNRGAVEIAIFERGIPTTIRTVSWSAEQGGDPTQAIIEKLVDSLRKLTATRRIQLAGELAGRAGFADQLRRALGDDYHVELLAEVSPLTALRRLNETGGISRLLRLRLGVDDSKADLVVAPLPHKWFAVAAALLIGLLGVRYAGPVVRKAPLERKLAEIATGRAALPPIEREVDFLRAVEKAQPAYLNALAVLADATPRGTRFDSLTLNRRGEFTFVATMQGAPQANELRTKLIDSGIFASAAIEEQTPDQNQRQVKVRIRARWDSSPDKKPPLIEKITSTSKTNAPSKGGKG